MPRYYCDYCDTYLTHDSPSVRKQHNAGYKHKANVRTYYQQFEEQQTQSLIDQRIKEHLGQAAAFQNQVGATFHQHLGALPMQRPRLPILPTPILPPNSTMPIGNLQLMPGIRPPVLPRPPPGTQVGYMPSPGVPQGMMPPGSGMQMGLPGPPPMNPSATVGTAPPTSANQVVYQAGPTSTSSGFNSYLSSSSGLQGSPSGAPAASATATQDGFKYSQASDANQ